MKLTPNERQAKKVERRQKQREMNLIRVKSMHKLGGMPAYV